MTSPHRDRSSLYTVILMISIVAGVIGAVIYFSVTGPRAEPITNGTVCGIVQDVQFLPSSYANNGGTQIRISNATYLFDATVNGLLVGHVYTFNYTMQKWDWKITSYHEGGCFS